VIRPRLEKQAEFFMKKKTEKGPDGGPAPSFILDFFATSEKLFTDASKMPVFDEALDREVLRIFEEGEKAKTPQSFDLSQKAIAKTLKDKNQAFISDCVLKVQPPVSECGIYTREPGMKFRNCLDTATKDLEKEVTALNPATAKLEALEKQMNENSKKIAPQKN
jgi:hypothetical protein